jgi:hypothetical protein
MNLKDNSILNAFLMHIPIGVLTVASLLVHPALVMITGLSFIAYEAIELFVINFLCSVKDKAYPELAGFLAGCFITATVMYILYALGINIPMMWRG